MEAVSKTRSLYVVIINDPITKLKSLLKFKFLWHLIEYHYADLEAKKSLNLDTKTKRDTVFDDYSIPPKRVGENNAPRTCVRSVAGAY